MTSAARVREQSVQYSHRIPINRPCPLIFFVDDGYNSSEVIYDEIFEIQLDLRNGTDWRDCHLALCVPY